MRAAVARRHGHRRRAHRARAACRRPGRCARHAVAPRDRRGRPCRGGHRLGRLRRRRARRGIRRLPCHRRLRRFHGARLPSARGGIMSTLLAGLFLLAGAAVSLLAAIGVLRLPDFFMRMHAATKAGVAGCGLVLIGVALADGSAATWGKVSVALVFLLLTTPVAGHLLGRAAYVSGAPFWHGTAEDALSGVLPRTDFESDEALDTQRGAQAGGIR